MNTIKDFLFLVCKNSVYLDIFCLKYAAKISQTASHPLRQYIPPTQRTGKPRHIPRAGPKCRTSLRSKSFFYKIILLILISIFCTWSNLPLQALIGENRVNIYLSNIYGATLILAAGLSQNYNKWELFPTTFFPL